MRRRRQQKHQDESGSSSGKQSPTTTVDQPEEWRLEAALVALLTLTDDDNRLVCPPFRVLPTVQEFPLYYEHIKTPIDLKRIAEHVREGKYTNWDAIELDVELMCKNAKQFNESDSMVYKDAGRLLQHFQTKVNELSQMRRFSARVISRNHQLIDDLLRSTASEIDQYSEDSEEDEDSESSDDPKWRLYWTIRNHNVVDGVPLCEYFMELPSKRSYPDYYEEIERPISLYMINKKLKRCHYSNLDQLVNDLLLIFANACSYNIEESDIFEAAIRLRNLTLDTAKLLDPEFQPPIKKEIIKTEVDTFVTNGVMMDDGMANEKRKLARSRVKQSTKYEALIVTEDTEAEEEEIEASEIIMENGYGSEHKKKRAQNQSASRDRQTSPSTSSPAPAVDDAPPIYSKRRRLNPDGTPMEKQKPGRKSVDELREKFTKVLKDVWQDVRDLKMGKRSLSDPFLYLPCNKTFPDYYTTIEKPMSLTCIKNKIDDSKYQDSDEMLRDLKTMCENARSYNRTGSQIHNDSSILESVAVGSMQMRTGGSTMFYPFRRSDKRWTEQSSITKSPFKSKKKGPSVESNVEENEKATVAPASTSDTAAANSVSQTATTSEAGPQTASTSTVNHFQPHPFHPGVYIAAAPNAFPGPPQQKLLPPNGLHPNTITSTSGQFTNFILQPSPHTNARPLLNGVSIQQMIGVSNHQQTSTNADICRHNATLAHAQAIAAESAHIAAVQQQLMDPGRIILNAPPKPPEPVFTAPSKSIHVQRVVHSETYLKYIESMFNAETKQQTISKWDKSLLVSQRNTAVPNHRKLPCDWIPQTANKTKEEGMVSALWKLRDQLVEGIACINRISSNPVEAEAPHPQNYDEPTTSNT